MINNGLFIFSFFPIFDERFDKICPLVLVAKAEGERCLTKYDLDCIIWNRYFINTMKGKRLENYCNKEVCMRIEIKSAEQWNTFEKARQDCVVTSSLYAYLTGTKWSQPDWAVMVWEDEEMVSNVHIIERTVRVGTKSVNVGGIGNIATKVEWRQRGYASAALKVAQDFLLDPLRVDFGLMIATEEMTSRYIKAGWTEVAHLLQIEQPTGNTTLNYPVMVLPVCKQNWPKGSINLCGLPW
jgi:aminoglycoside 2'-N-acetyltransferase I